MKLKDIISTARPKTLPLALSPVLISSSLAYQLNQFNLLIVLLSVVTILLLQILSNFANDLGDHQKGSDQKNRIGPTRAIQQGKISYLELKKATISLACLCFLSGLALIKISNLNFTEQIVFNFLILISIVAAITYTVGKYAYGYYGFGDLFVLLFFGWIGIIGVFYLQTKNFDPLILLPATGSGLLAVAVLNINNLRDINQDRLANKKTIPVRFGLKAGKIYHLLILTLALTCFTIFGLIYFKNLWQFLFLLIGLKIFNHGKFIWQYQNANALYPKLAEIAKTALLVNLTISFVILLN